MKKEFSILKEWAINYIKNRDILLRSIQKIEENKEGWDFIVRTNSGDKYYIIMPFIKDFKDITGKIDDKYVTVVALNIKENLELLIQSWKSISGYPKLCIMFANPNSQAEKRWSVYPKTHEIVTEKASLVRGLKALFQTVDEWR